MSEWVELQSFLPGSGKTQALHTHGSGSVPDWKPLEGLLNNKDQKDPNRIQIMFASMTTQESNPPKAVGPGTLSEGAARRRQQPFL